MYHKNFYDTSLFFRLIDLLQKIVLKAVLFDMDGVLYDSMKNHAESWYETAIHFGIKADYRQFYMYEGQTGAQTIEDLMLSQRGRHATQQEIEEIYAYKSSLFEKRGKTPIMSGALDVLRVVTDMGLNRIIVTGSGQATLLDRLSEHFPGMFSADRIVSAKDVPVGCGKPKPDPYLMGLRKAGNLSPSEAIVIENAPLGVRAARAAGIFTIAVNTGPLDSMVLEAEGANIVLGGMKELSEKFKDIVRDNFLFP